jgi:hypothetical protein
MLWGNFMRMRFGFGLLMILVIPLPVWGQFPEMYESASLQIHSVDFDDFILEVENAYKVKFFYPVRFEKIKINSLRIENESLIELLDKISIQYQIQYFTRSPNYIILYGKGKSLLEEEEDSRVFKESQIISFLGAGEEKDWVSIIGYVKNGKTGNPIDRALITIKDQPKGGTTNSDGYYSLLLRPGTYQLKFQFAGLVPMEYVIEAYADGALNVLMFEELTQLSEVTIYGRGERANVEDMTMGKVTISQKELQKVPSFLGETDVVRAILSTPGVNNVGEGTTGFNVRGGSTGQNNFIVDNFTVYNPSHLAGIFSSLNSDIIKNVELYKGTAPSRYGGRASGILNIQLTEGNKKGIKGTGGVGLLASRLMLEGPIRKDSTSFLISGRWAYPNYIVRSLEDIRLKRSSADFSDFNFKVNSIGKNNGVWSLSAYSSKDNINFSNEANYRYGNNAASITYGKPVKNKYYFEGDLAYSHYYYRVGEGEIGREANMFSEINDMKGRISISTMTKNNHQLEVGIQTNVYEIAPGIFKPNNPESNVERVTLPFERGIESAFFIEDEFTLHSNLRLSAGLRASGFYRLGPGREPIYPDDEPRSTSTLEGYVEYARNEVISANYGLEPRLMLNWKLTETSAIKIGYHRMVQYIHLITNSIAITPLDIWKLSNNYIKPSFISQSSLGVFKNSINNSFEFSIEGYYRGLNNVIEYRDGAQVYLNPELENDLLQGKGSAYGIEFQAKKIKGRLLGDFSYTYSRTFYKFQSEYSENRINNGNWFPSNFDRPHDLQLNSNYKLTNRVSFSGLFTYSTGRPITFPENIYMIGGVQVADFSERNQYRIPNFHRLDLSLTMATSLKKKKAVEANWTLTLFNVYGRKNPYSVFFRREEGRQEISAYQLAIFGRPFIAATYNFNF